MTPQRPHQANDEEELWKSALSLVTWGVSWGVLGPSWRGLGGSCGIFQASWEGLGMSLGDPGWPMGAKIATSKLIIKLAPSKTRGGSPATWKNPYKSRRCRPARTRHSNPQNIAKDGPWAQNLSTQGST